MRRYPFSVFCVFDVELSIVVLHEHSTNLAIITRVIPTTHTAAV